MNHNYTLGNRPRLDRLSVIAAAAFLTFAVAGCVSNGYGNAGYGYSGNPQSIFQPQQTYERPSADSVARQCDEMAYAPEEREHLFPGVPFDRLDFARGAPICATALQSFPNHGRLNYQYARLLASAQRYSEAVTYYQRAIELGHELAAIDLGLLYVEGMGVAKNPIEAARLFEATANRDYAIPQFCLAAMYLSGLGVPLDPNRAFSLMDRAARQGLPIAQLAVAKMHEKGIGVAPNPATAAQIYASLFNAGEVGVEARAALGMLQFEGRGVRQSYGDAGELFHSAASQGHIPSSFMLGWMYSHGNGVAPDYLVAKQWYERAANAGHVDAQYQLGELYRLGFRDASSAVLWYRRAAEQGHPDARRSLAQMYPGETGLALARTQAAESSSGSDFGRTDNGGAFGSQPGGHSGGSSSSGSSSNVSGVLADLTRQHPGLAVVGGFLGALGAIYMTTHADETPEEAANRLEKKDQVRWCMAAGADEAFCKTINGP